MAEVLDTLIDNPIIQSVDVTVASYQSPVVAPIDLTQAQFQLTPVAPIDVTGVLFQLPETASAAMYAPVVEVSITDLTTGSINGTGAFDLIMATVSAQLQAEFQADRITGAEYTKAYIENTQAAMQAALQLILGKQQAFWAAQTGQIQSINARLTLEESRYSYQNLTTAQVATARVALETARFNYQNALPAQLATARLALESARFTYQNIQPAQLQLLNEQGDQARAQTSDTRLDGVAIAGVMGAQERLYNQQITSYQRDAECKAAKIFTDAWITQKTIDSGLTAPMGFTNDSVNQILTVIMGNNSFGTPVA